jgi:hypothetical protein
MTPESNDDDVKNLGLGTPFFFFNLGLATPNCVGCVKYWDLEHPNILENNTI